MTTDKQPAPAAPVTDEELDAAIEKVSDRTYSLSMVSEPWEEGPYAASVMDAKDELRALIARLVAQEAAAAEIRVGRLVLAIETVRRFENHAERDESLIRRCWVEVGDALAAFRAARAVG